VKRKPQYICSQYLLEDIGLLNIPDRKAYPSGKARNRYAFFAVLALPFREILREGSFSL
jgi:hypothetical protein